MKEDRAIAKDEQDIEKQEISREPKNCKEINKQYKNKQNRNEQQINGEQEIQQVENDAIFKTLNAEQICVYLCGSKKLDSKNNLLDYLDTVRKLKAGCLSDLQLQETYNYIEQWIEKLKGSVKPNTVLYLKKVLNEKLGRYVPSKTVKQENQFLKFFIEAYPKDKRNREYTWVLVDLDRINEGQMLHTLKYINGWCFKNKLTGSEKKDIIAMIKKLVAGGNLKYINQVRSLEGLCRALKIKIISSGSGYLVEEKKNKEKKLIK